MLKFMLDRMGLSVKNGWIDEKNHVCIYFTLEEAMEYMRIGKDKGVKLFSVRKIWEGGNAFLRIECMSCSFISR